MSRRDSRGTLNVRQNDALMEFENFKKKFLLANKHITKLNSTLSIRIEELNAQIANLLAENVSLRTNNIALDAQLQREKVKSRKIMAESESATSALMKHLSALRHSLGVPHGLPSIPAPSSPHARKPTRDANASPPLGRLARAPDYPCIVEEEERSDCERDGADSPSPSIRRRARPRLSVSRLPVPLRPPSPVALPLDPAPLDEDVELPREKERRKPARRQSGMVSPTAVVAVEANPVGSANVTSRRPRRHTAVDDVELMLPLRSSTPVEHEEPIEVVDNDEDAVEVMVIKREKKPRSKEKQEVGVESAVSGHARRRSRDDEEYVSEGLPPPKTKSKSKLADVTNSPRKRLSALDTKKTADSRDRHVTPESDPALLLTRPLLATPSAPPAIQYLPTPESSNGSPLTELYEDAHRDAGDAADAAEATGGGRERRVRKSVNYAEPKLNTKMRKPREEAGSSSKRRASSVRTPVHAEAPWADRVPLAELDDEADSPPQDEAPSPEPLPAPIPLAAPTLATAAAAGPKRKRASASHAVRVAAFGPDGEESDGAQADGEFAVSGALGVAGRRRSALVARGVPPGMGGEGVRRHSMAI